MGLLDRSDARNQETLEFHRAAPSERRALGAVFAIYAGVLLAALVAVLLLRR